MMTDDTGGLHATATFFFPFDSRDQESMRRAKNIFQDVLDFARERGAVECAVEYYSDRLWPSTTEQPAALTASLDAVVVHPGAEFPSPVDVGELTDIPTALRRAPGDTP